MKMLIFLNKSIAIAYIRSLNARNRLKNIDIWAPFTIPGTLKKAKKFGVH